MINEQSLGTVANSLNNPKMEDNHLYGTMEGIVTPALDSKKPVGGHGVEAPVYQNGVATNGVTATTADMTNSGTNLNQTYDHANLSAKFKNPRVSQEIPEAGRGQYM